MWPSLCCGDIVLLPMITFLVIRVWGSRHNEAKCWFLWFTETLHRHNGFYTVHTVCAIALHLNLALRGGISTFPQKNSLCMIYKHFELWGNWKCPHLIGRIVGRFSRRCAHSHWRLLFSHEVLNVGEYRVRNSSRCVRAFRLKGTF